MPELPEVETIRRGLEKHIIGYTITSIDIRLPKMFIGESDNIIGGTFTTIRRYGKGLVIDVDNGYSLAIHVKMTGQLVFKKQVFPPVNMHVSSDKTEVLPNKWTHVIFSLKKQDEGADLFYNDIRQFGWIKVVKTSKISELPFFKSIGPEPLKDLSLLLFSKIVKKSKVSIKQLIMDQGKMAGVGNIYANDALWEAMIHPLRSASTLTDIEIQNLFLSIENVLTEGIERGGASEMNYINVSGGKGSYQEVFRVYKKDKKHCIRCNDIIIRIAIGGRGTFFCQTCQK